MGDKQVEQRIVNCIRLSPLSLHYVAALLEKPLRKEGVKIMRFFFKFALPVDRL